MNLIRSCTQQSSSIFSKGIITNLEKKKIFLYLRLESVILRICKKKKPIGINFNTFKIIIDKTKSKKCISHNKHFYKFYFRLLKKEINENFFSSILIF